MTIQQQIENLRKLAAEDAIDSTREKVLIKDWLQGRAWAYSCVADWLERDVLPTYKAQNDKSL